MRQPVRRTRVETVALAAAGLTALAVLAGCTGGGAAKPTPTPAPTSSAAPGSVRVGKLAFVPPEGFTVRAKDARRNQNSSWEAQGERRPPAAAPLVDVFVEKGKVGDLTVRGAEIKALANVQLRDSRVVSDRRVKVPGALGARVIELSYVCVKQPKGVDVSASPSPEPSGGSSTEPSSDTTSGTGKGGKGKGGKDGGSRAPVRCHQVEYLVETASAPAYGLRYFASGSQYDPAVRDALLASLRVSR